MSWSFAERSGTLAINNFDANGAQGPLNVSGPMTIPGELTNQFGGSLEGTVGVNAINGAATGSFVKGPISPAQGVIGNWNVGNPSYKATGVFAGSGIPEVPR